LGLSLPLKQYRRDFAEVAHARGQLGDDRPCLFAGCNGNSAFLQFGPAVVQTGRDPKCW
jgi:hypothetical protein